MKIPGVLLACALAVPLVADEGMWLFNQFPKDQVKKTYSFEVSDELLENLRLATLRIGGSSGSFVSPQGLVLTNRGAATCAGTETFYAAAQSAEKACPGLEASVLLGMEDVTSQVKEPPKETPKGAKAAPVE